MLATLLLENKCFLDIVKEMRILRPVNQMKGVDPQGEDDENDDDILDGELVLRHPRVVPILSNINTLTLFYTCTRIAACCTKFWYRAACRAG
jgi:hypothetical protein